MSCFDRCFHRKDDNKGYREEKENFNYRTLGKNKKIEDRIVYKNLSEVDSAIKKLEHKKDRIQVYGNYFDYLNKEIQQSIGHLKLLESPKAKVFSDEYEKIKGQIEFTLTEALKGKNSLLHRYARFSHASHEKRQVAEKKLEDSIKRLSDLHETLINEYQKPEVQEKIRQEIDKCQKVYDLYTSNLEKVQDDLKRSRRQWAQRQEQISKYEAVFNESQQALADFNQLKSDHKNMLISPPDKFHAQIDKFHAQRENFWLAYRGMYPILEEEQYRYENIKYQNTKDSALHLDFSTRMLLTERIQKLVDLRQWCSPKLQEEVKELQCEVKELHENIIAITKQIQEFHGNYEELDNRWNELKNQISSPIKAIQEINKNLPRKDRIHIYAYYADKLKHQIQPIMRDLTKDLSDKYEKIKGQIELALEKATKRKYSLFDCGAMFSDTCHKKRETDEEELIKSIRSLEDLINICKKIRNEGQIRADERCKVEDQFWTYWEEQRREKLQETLQSIERKLQRTEQQIQICEENLQILENLPVGHTVPEKLMQNASQLLHSWLDEERELGGEVAVLDEKLKGLPRERLRWKIQQRVDAMLSRQPAWEQLQSQVLELQESVIRDYHELEPEEKLLKAEFQGILDERMMHHGRSEQERIDILGNLTGIRPQY